MFIFCLFVLAQKIEPYGSSFVSFPPLTALSVMSFSNVNIQFKLSTV